MYSLPKVLSNFDFVSIVQHEETIPNYFFYKIEHCKHKAIQYLANMAKNLLGTFLKYNWFWYTIAYKFTCTNTTTLYLQFWLFGVKTKEELIYAFVIMYMILFFLNELKCLLKKWMIYSLYTAAINNYIRGFQSTTVPTNNCGKV